MTHNKMSSCHFNCVVSSKQEHPLKYGVQKCMSISFDVKLVYTVHIGHSIDTVKAGQYTSVSR